MAGGGGRVAFAGGNQPINSFATGELGVMTGSGTNRLPLMTMTGWDLQAPEITRDGTRVVFESNMDPFGTNPDGGSEIFRIQADGTGLVQVTNLPSASAYGPSITADGNIIVFSSNAGIAGGYAEAFRINADGTGIQQLTHSSPTSYDPRVSANGSVVVFNNSIDNVAVVNVNGTGQQNLTSGGCCSLRPSVDDTGTWTTFDSNVDLDGQGPYGVNQAFRMRSDGGDVQRVSIDTSGGGYYAQISSAGNRILYWSTGNPVGSNPNHNAQLFTYDTTTSQTSDVTMATGAVSFRARSRVMGIGWSISPPLPGPSRTRTST